MSEPIISDFERRAKMILLRSVMLSILAFFITVILILISSTVNQIILSLAFLMLCIIMSHIDFNRKLNKEVEEAKKVRGKLHGMQ